VFRKPFEVDKKRMDKVDEMLNPHTIRINAEAKPESVSFNFSLNTKDDLKKLLNGLLLSYDGCSEEELVELDLPLEKINRLKEILFRKC
jgi:hypothetical protein